MKNKTVFLFSVAFMGCIILFFLFRPNGEEEVQGDPLQQAPESMFVLGNEYFYGTETRKANPKLAAYWFRKASDEIPEAMYNYGFCLEQGLGVDRDPIAAAECYRKAAEKKCQPAEFKHAMVMLNGVEFRTDEERSKFNVENIPARDPEKARKMIGALADSGYLPAMVELAAILIADPRNVEKADAEKAFNLVFDAVKAPDAPSRAWRILGDCYFYGLGTTSDGKKMIETLEKAASMGNMEALFRIGYCYEFGVNVDADPQRALECYECAAKAGLAGADEAVQRVARNYYNQLVTFLQSQWKAVSPSSVELGGKGSTWPVVDLTIAKDGKISRAFIVSKSSNKTVDDAVTDLLAKLKVVPVPPQAAVFRVTLETE